MSKPTGYHTWISRTMNESTLRTAKYRDLKLGHQTPSSPFLGYLDALKFFVFKSGLCALKFSTTYVKTNWIPYVDIPHHERNHPKNSKVPRFKAWAPNSVFAIFRVSRRVEIFCL